MEKRIHTAYGLVPYVTSGKKEEGLYCISLLGPVTLKNVTINSGSGFGTSVRQAKMNLKLAIETAVQKKKNAYLPSIPGKGKTAGIARIAD